MSLLILDREGEPELIRRVPQGEARREHALRDLIYEHPGALPVHEFDPGYGRVFALAREFSIPGAGYVDVLLADERGRLIVVECKLWRNPQARREVVGQILDYARELSRFSYEDLQRQIAIATKGQGNIFYEMARAVGGQLDEAVFVDRVSRDLAGGRFLLLVVGDGIAEGTRRIGEYLQGQPGLAFDFGLVELAEYRWREHDGSERTIIQPRILARTTVIERAVIRNEAAVMIEDLREAATAPPGRELPGRKLDPGMQRQWRAFAETFIAEATFDDPSQPPPRIGGLGWMRMPLPEGHWITLWRRSDNADAGAAAILTGGQGQAAFEALGEERAIIDEEFATAGLPAPVWERREKNASISLTWPAPQPWDGTAEEIQRSRLLAAANQLVNSLRPRLERAARSAGLPS